MQFKYILYVNLRKTSISCLISYIMAYVINITSTKLHGFMKFRTLIVKFHSTDRDIKENNSSCGVFCGYFKHFRPAFK